MTLPSRQSKDPVGIQYSLCGDYVKKRPKGTTIATQTPWRELQKLAAENGVGHPGDVTPELMRKFVDEMAVRVCWSSYFAQADR
ncbi:hypothetical protein GCM10011496_28300 [Polaromonas eurypsychrophila]|uniref:Uncharacterized protein n=1 Tax=Polaromonas eurypsychrophila TaxID=1614635 RepID=A0A916SL23_9BURK|nr:hypothetical protein GCM10011496_28300 [Polaromonas eurypsychrophila]